MGKMQAGSNKWHDSFLKWQKFSSR